MIIPDKPCALQACTRNELENVSKASKQSSWCPISPVLKVNRPWNFQFYFCDLCFAICDVAVDDHPKYRTSEDRQQLTISDLCKDCTDSSSDLAVIQCNASNVHGYAFADGYINVLSELLIKIQLFSWSEESVWLPYFPTFFVWSPTFFSLYQRRS